MAHEAPWTLQPGVLAGMAIAAAWYTAGVYRLWRRAGRRRGIAPWRVGACAAALLVLLVALISPLDSLGDALFSAHMAQHMLLLAVVPPLLVAGAPLYAALWALPRGWRRALGGWWHRATRLRRLVRRTLQPLPVWIAYAVILWFWHLPATYDLAERHEIVHAMEHLSFVTSAFFFWWIVFRYPGRRMDRGGAILYVFTAGLQCAALGAILTFSSHAWYDVDVGGMRAWGLTPIQDQQLAGLIMWIPAGLLNLGAAAALFIQWIEPADRPVALIAHYGENT